MKTRRRSSARLAVELGRVIHSATSAQERALRRLSCARCGTAFECGDGGKDGGCWCADESFRLPMPAAGEDCLCPACLRAAAGAAGLPA